MKKQLEELNAKYESDTKALNEKLTAQETDFAAERLLSGYKFANDRVKKSVLEELYIKRESAIIRRIVFKRKMSNRRQMHVAEPDAVFVYCKARRFPKEEQKLLTAHAEIMAAAGTAAKTGYTEHER